MRESRYVKVARLAYQIAKQELPLYSHPKSPHKYTFPQLASCLILTFYLNMSYRDAEEWLLASDKVCNALGLRQVPDHSTICRVYARLTKALMEKMLRRLLKLLGIQEEFICFDTTGFRESHESAYYLSRTGRRYRSWRKGAYAVGAKSQMVLATGHGRGPGSDSVFLNLLKRKSSVWGKKERGRRAWLCLADSGFDGEGVSQLDIGTKKIYFKSNLLCCKDGEEELTLTVKVTPKQGGKDERKQLCEGSPPRLSDSKAGTSPLLSPQKPSQIHLPPTCIMPHSDILPEYELP